MRSIVQVSAGTRVLVVVSMVVVIVTLDVEFFRGHFWPRLLANIGVVLLMGAFWWRFAPVSDEPGPAGCRSKPPLACACVCAWV